MNSVDRSRAGSILVKLPEDMEKDVAVYAARMGRKLVVRKGHDVLVWHSMEDAIIDLAMKGLGAAEDTAPRVGNDASPANESA